MRRVWRRWVVAPCVVLLLAGAAPPYNGRVTAAACALPVRTLPGPQGRVDGLAPAGRSIVALVGASSSGVPFLPHDDLLVLAPDGRVRARVALPSYTVPPGLAVALDARGTVQVVVDDTLLTLDAGRGRVVARRPLDLQALGWPAAVAAGTHGWLYVAGQPPAGRVAVLEAIVAPAAGRLRVAWRAPLGLTHAGIWVGLAGRGLVAAYLPNADDVHGTVALFDERTGALRASYDVPVSPAAADPAHDRLYLDDAGTIRVLTLRGGVPVASIPGVRPLALDTAHDLLAYTQHNGIVLASARTLRPLARVPVSGALSLAFAPAGLALLVGRRSGLTRIDIERCAIV